MHVVWKRPDGFLGAEPTDFVTVVVADHARLWLHKEDRKWFPFRISGGWQDQEATQRLNGFINLIGKPTSQWVDQMVHEFDHSMADEPTIFFEESLAWLTSLRAALKGDTWEVEIMDLSIKEVESKIHESKDLFLKNAQ